MLRAVVSQQPSSASTFFRTVLPVGSPEESRNTSTVISRGSGPRNSGLLPLRTAGLGVNFQLAPRLMVSCAGLKSKWNVRMSPPGVVLLPRGGSWMEREARTRLLPAPLLLLAMGSFSAVRQVVRLRTARQSVKPWWAISRTSVATAGLAGSRRAPAS